MAREASKSFLTVRLITSNLLRAFSSARCASSALSSTAAHHVPKARATVLCRIRWRTRKQAPRPFLCHSAPSDQPWKARASSALMMRVTTRRANSRCRDSAAFLKAAACSAPSPSPPLRLLPRVHSANQANAAPSVTARSSKRRSAIALPSAIWRSSRSTASVTRRSRSRSSSSSRRVFLSSRASSRISSLPMSTASTHRSKARSKVLRSSSSFCDCGDRIILGSPAPNARLESGVNDLSSAIARRSSLGTTAGRPPGNVI